MLRVPGELQKLCKSMQIDSVDLPDWYAEFCLPTAINNPPFLPEPSPEKSPYQYGKHRRNTNRSN